MVASLIVKQSTFNRSTIYERKKPFHGIYVIISILCICNAVWWRNAYAHIWNYKWNTLWTWMHQRRERKKENCETNKQWNKYIYLFNKIILERENKMQQEQQNGMKTRIGHATSTRKVLSALFHHRILILFAKHIFSLPSLRICFFYCY